MKISKSKLNKYLVIFLCVIFIASTVLVTGNFIKEKSNNKASISSDDKKIVSQISNTTGLKIDEVIKLKESGLSWNEILEKGKSKNGNDKENVKAMGNLLASNGIKDEFFKKLKNEGFKDEEITAAKMVVDRVAAELSELTNMKEDSAVSGLSNSSTNNNIKENEVLRDTNNNLKSNLESDNSKDLNSTNAVDEMNQYKSIVEKFDSEKAIYMLLKLKNQFGSLEEVMDEYLCSIQIEVDLEKCITDKKAYDKEKAEKLLGIDSTKLITLAKIEAKILEKAQKTNIRNSTISDTNLEKQQSKNQGNSDKTESDQTIQSPLPDAGNPKPVNPSKDMMTEINEINNKSLNMDGR